MNKTGPTTVNLARKKKTLKKSQPNHKTAPNARLRRKIVDTTQCDMIPGQVDGDSQHSGKIEVSSTPPAMNLGLKAKPSSSFIFNRTKSTISFDQPHNSALGTIKKVFFAGGKGVKNLQKNVTVLRNKKKFPKNSHSLYHKFTQDLTTNLKSIPLILKNSLKTNSCSYFSTSSSQSVHNIQQSVENENALNFDQIVANIEDPVQDLTPTITTHLDDIFSQIITNHQHYHTNLFNLHFPNQKLNKTSTNLKNGQKHQRDTPRNPPTPPNPSELPSTHLSSTPPTPPTPPTQTKATLNDGASIEDTYEFEHFFHHIYPIQHKKITPETPIVVMSTITFQQYVSQTFELISQYKAFLADPHNNPLPPTVHTHTNPHKNRHNDRNNALNPSAQTCTPRSLAVATFMNYPLVTLDNLGLSVEALAYSCGFSHESIPTAYKCLGPILKHRYQDPIGLEVRHQLKKGLVSKHAGTNGKATEDDLNRWTRQVDEHMIEIERQQQLKVNRAYADTVGKDGESKFSGRYEDDGGGGDDDDGDDDGEKNPFHSNNEVDPIENELRLMQQVEELEHKSQEKIIRAMISQQLFNLGVKAVVVVDDVVESRHEKFFHTLQLYLTQVFGSVDKKMGFSDINNDDVFVNDDGIKKGNSRNEDDVSIEDAYSFSGDILQNKELINDNNGNNDNNDDELNLNYSDNNQFSKLTKKELKISLKKLYTHFLYTMYPENSHFSSQTGNFEPDSTKGIVFNPQFTQSFFEWLVGFGLSPLHFNQHQQSILPLIVNNINTPGSVINGDLRPDLAAYINSTVDLIKGLHLTHVDGALYGDIIGNSKSGGIYGLLLKKNFLTKKQVRKRRQHENVRKSQERLKNNREEMRRKLGGDDENGWDDDGDDGDGDGDDDDDDDDNDDDEEDPSEDNIDNGDDDIDELDRHFEQSNKKLTMEEKINELNIKNEKLNDEKLSKQNTKKSSQTPEKELAETKFQTDSTQIQNSSFDSLILSPDAVEGAPTGGVNAHVEIDQINSLKKLILQKENVLFGPLVGVDFVSGIARTKRLRGAFDQRSPLIQAVLGARNAVRATPNTKNPLLDANENYAISKFQTEFSENLIQNDLQILHNQPKINSINDLVRPNSGSNNGDKLLPFWEQLDLEQGKFDADASSFFSQKMSSNNLLTRNNTNISFDPSQLSTQAQHLLSHYDAVDRDSPLGEIVPLGTLQEREIKQQEEKKYAQLRHLKEQQKVKQERQMEWLETVQRHVHSGHARIVDDDVEALFRQANDDFIPNKISQHDDGNIDARINPLSSLRSTNSKIAHHQQHFTSTSSTSKVIQLPLDPSLPPLPLNGVILPSEKKKYIREEVTMNYSVFSETHTKLTKQQRIYSENSAYIVRYYSHQTNIVKTPLIDRFSEEVLSKIDQIEKEPQYDSSTTETTTVSRLLRICDVTGGFGTDSFILASSVNQNKDLEVEINMVEGDKILYTLLADGIRRAQQVHRYDDLVVPQLVPKQNRTPRKGNGSSIGGFDVEKMYDDDDDGDDDGDGDDNGDDNNGPNGSEDNDDEEDYGFARAAVPNSTKEQQEIIQSLKRDRYFPHSKVALPKIHGLDMNDPAVQRKLKKQGRYGHSEQDLQFEKMIKQQERIVELAEKTLKDYIEGGMGVDNGVGSATGNKNQNDGQKPQILMNQVALPGSQSFSSKNPLLRNKMLSKQHLSEVGLIAKRMNVVYGNSLEFLTRTHFRVPAVVAVPNFAQNQAQSSNNDPDSVQTDDIMAKFESQIPKQRTLGTLFAKIQNRLKHRNIRIDLSQFISHTALKQFKSIPTTPDVNIDGVVPSFVFAETITAPTVLKKKLNTSDDGDDKSDDEGDGDGYQSDYDDDDDNYNDDDDDDDDDDRSHQEYNNNNKKQPKKVRKRRRGPRPSTTPTLSITLPNPSQFNSNPHQSPVFSPNSPYPVYTSQTNLDIHRPYDVVYMDPFYPTKNQGKRAKYKMLQRNSKFMSFAKSLQDIYSQQEVTMSYGRQRKEVLLSRLINFAVDKQSQLLSNKMVMNSLTKDGKIKDQFDPNGTPVDGKGFVDYHDLGDLYHNLQTITDKLSLLQTVSQDLTMAHHQKDLNSGIDQETTKPNVDVMNLRHFEEKNLLVLNTAQQYEIYSLLIKSIQTLMANIYYNPDGVDGNGDVGDKNHKQNGSNFKNLKSKVIGKTKLSFYQKQLKLSNQLSQIYVTLYTTAPQLLPLYTNALLTVTHQQKQDLTQVDHFHVLGNETEPFEPTETKFLQPTYPNHTTNQTNSLILTREPENTHILFDAARITANRRVVLKRPIYAPVIHKTHTISIEDNKTRFDVVTPLLGVNYTNRVLHSVLNRVRWNYNFNYKWRSREYYNLDDDMGLNIGDSKTLFYRERKKSHLPTTLERKNQLITNQIENRYNKSNQNDFYSAQHNQFDTKHGALFQNYRKFIGQTQNATQNSSQATQSGNPDDVSSSDNNTPNSILCYDNNNDSRNPLFAIYNSKLLSRGKLPAWFPTPKHLRAPWLPYIAYTTFGSYGTSGQTQPVANNDNKKKTQHPKHGFGNKGDKDEPVAKPTAPKQQYQVINRQKELKLITQREDAKMRSNQRKEKRKSKGK